MLTTIIHFDIAALFIFAITIFYTIYRRIYKSYSSFMFLLINIMYFIICLIDIFLSTDGLLPVTINKIFMFLYFLLKYQASILFVLYIILVTNSSDIIKKKKNGILFSIPFLVTFGFLISNIFNGYIYYYDEFGVYQRGDLIFVFYGLTFIYVVIGLIWLLVNRKIFSFPDLFSLFSVYVLSIAALIIQYFKAEVLIEILFTSLALFLLTVTVESSNLIVDSKTGLKNKVIFERKVYTSFRRNKKQGLVLLYIKNHYVIYEKYNYDIAIKHIRELSTYLSKAFITDIQYQSYFLDSGIFALITKNFSDAEILAKKINEEIINTYEVRFIFNIDHVLSYSEIPTDFNNYKDFFDYIYNFSDSLDNNSKLINISKIKKEEAHNIIVRLDDILEKVIAEKSVFLEFQPLFELKSKKYTGIEALARIKDDEVGIINADSFIPYAEKTDKIYEIDMVTIERLYEFYKKYNLLAYGIKYIALNISTQTLCKKEFLNDLKNLEIKYNIDRKYVFFEIKEREENSFNQYAFDTILFMMKNGYLFSLDNYGIGSMPVDNLAKVPFSNIKFDNIFAESCINDKTRIVLDNTIKLFKNLNKASICAGVENAESAEILESLNPDYLQGYYYSKPLSSDKLFEFLEKNNK